MKGCFITATGTDAGKTMLAKALTLALRQQGLSVAAVKPVETGCEAGVAVDAQALAQAAGDCALAYHPGFYRAEPPLAPLSVSLEGGPRSPAVHELARAVQQASAGREVLLVEGAGGPLVPLDDQHNLIDLAVALELPVVLVAPDRLGVLSHVLTAAESLAARSLTLNAVVLNRPGAAPLDPSVRRNREVLASRLSRPVYVLGRAPTELAPLQEFVRNQPWLLELVS